ncbi:Beta-elim-lyase domain-containing protein [Fusarium keratoplasticum]|uniref:Beta-elim-lyase domain-containing protein n=1 Tax=Fusarium keratoplasticum TaxID=1328300 RepID=A0ACC0RBE3_9HYPO|nr:Beta-elim-lyase domain-containing protein [Fusarium keratoplasticum]KAI8680469.1 Beta-elim-lyase domain-containing protein [Fusarium keratoplasticum]
MGSMMKEVPCTHWLQNGRKDPASLDLRSDTITIPTASMLNAIQPCTLGDDVFGEDDSTNQLETCVAKRIGKEAGLSVLSGTMGNQLALRSLLTQLPHSVLCDCRSQIFVHEAGGTSSLSGAQFQPVVPKNGKYLTLEGVHDHVVLGQDIHSCPTRDISLENTIHGLIIRLKEIERICLFAREHGIKMHLDGARLW